MHWLLKRKTILELVEFSATCSVGLSSVMCFCEQRN